MVSSSLTAIREASDDTREFPSDGEFYWLYKQSLLSWLLK